LRYRSHARIHAILTEHPGEPRSERTFTTSEDLRAGASGTWFLSPLGLVVVLLVLAANRAQRSPEFVSWRTMARLMSDVMPHSKMQDCIDYDAVAELYDLYAAATYDYDFFLSRISPGMRVLELTSGTGRLSIPLAKAGAVITCVDISQGMLSVLERKLEKGGLQANLLCADIQHLDFNEEFKIAVLPFQSFMELVGKEKQLNTLRSIYQALMLNGRFYCTMHNPAVRRSMVDGVVRAVGSLNLLEDTLW
jgi:SAM-dependent methyltransferase